jgi:peptide/nickel transport system permease protein
MAATQLPTTTAAPREQTESLSQFQVFGQQFRKNRSAILGLIMLVILYTGALFAPFLAPYGMDEYSTTDITGFAPPTRIYWTDPKTGAFGPFVYRVERKRDLETFQLNFTENKSVQCPVKFLVRSSERKYTLFGFVPGDLHLFGVDEPCKVYLFGADEVGRDLFSRVWYGSQVSLTIGILSVLVSFSFGLLMGGIAGFFGGWIDNLIMRITEILSAIPGLFLLAILTSYLPKSVNPLLLFYSMVVVLAFVDWGGLARLVRGQILSLREADFVQAATALGARPGRIIARHLLPNIASYMLTLAFLSIPTFILSESTLSFLGYGVREPQASWGALLQDVQDGGFGTFIYRPWILIPGFFIVLAILAWNLFGDGVRDAFDPKKRR